MTLAGASRSRNACCPLPLTNLLHQGFTDSLPGISLCWMFLYQFRAALSRKDELRILLLQPTPHRRYRFVRPADIWGAGASRAEYAARCHRQALIEDRIDIPFATLADERGGLAEE